MLLKFPQQCFLTLFVLLCMSSSYAENKPTVPVSELPQKPICADALQRPCVALVLGGGGARGGAHIGVLKVLEEKHIPIDLIVGTSIGSFVGGLYASGRTAVEIESMFHSADWDAGYQDDLSRSLIPNRRKRQLDNFPIHVDIGFDGHNLKMPRGFIQGQGMIDLLNSMVGSYPRFASFDQLPIPYRAVAADVETGEEVVLNRGDLASAMQASMSLPGIVRPVEKNGRILVDGGIANNLPISVAKSLGAQVIIAVNIGSPELHREELTSSFTIIRQLTGFLTHNNVDYQKSLLQETDVFIEPPIEDVGMLDFDKVGQTIDIGYTETLKVFEQSAMLQQLAQLNIARVVSEPVASDVATRIDKIQLTNHSRLADDFLLHRMGLNVGQAYSQNDLAEATDKLYGQGSIARISTSIDKKQQLNVLNVLVEEKEWGPGYLDFKFSMEDDFDSFSRYQMGASYRLTNLTPYGAEWYSSAEIGTDKRINSEFYFPLRNSGFFWMVRGEYERETYEYIASDELLGEVFVNRSRMDTGMGWDALDQFDVVLSLLYQDAYIKTPTIFGEVLGIDEIKARQKGTALTFNFDSLNDATFPNAGWKLTTRIERTKDDYLDTTEFSTKADAEFNGVKSFGKHSFRSRARFQSVISENALGLLSGYSLGGFLNLSGIPARSMNGQHVRFVSEVYTYQLAANDFGAFSLPLYVGASIEAGNVWSERADIDYDEIIQSGSIFIGWNGILGPTYLAYGRTDDDQSSFYLFVGKTF